MTLLYTEISQEFPIHGRCVFFAADRGITPFGTGRPTHYKKLVDVPYLNAALGFFGLAEFRHGARGFRMADHLRDFVRQQHAAPNLSAFATNLTASLNAFVPSSLRGSERSGIHLAGITRNALPEFWFVRNVDDTGAPTLGKYEAHEQFLARDARSAGFDGQNPQTLPSGGRLYRNGDIISHVVAWEAFDNTLGALLTIPFFTGIGSPNDYACWIRFKMEILVHFHKRFEKTLLVGGPIDTIVKYQHEA
jgi:hypothetical protein